MRGDKGRAATDFMLFNREPRVSTPKDTENKGWELQSFFVYYKSLIEVQSFSPQGNSVWENGTADSLKKPRPRFGVPNGDTDRTAMLGLIPRSPHPTLCRADTESRTLDRASPWNTR